MIKTTLFVLIFIFLFSVAFIPLKSSQQNNSIIKISEDIELIHLKDSVFIVTTWFESDQFGRFASNGLLYVKNAKAVLVDTPNNNEQTAQLYSYLKDSMHVTIQKVIVCHFHSDCLGGLEFINRQGIASIALDLTKNICVEKNLPRPSVTFSDKLEFKFEGSSVICQYFGPGHTVDNIVVYFPDEKILFGGCLVKSLSADNMGNTADAVVDKWAATIKNIQNTYKKVEFVVPGHGEYGNGDLLNHTISLINHFKK